MHPFEDLAVPENRVGIHWFGQSSFGLRNSSGEIVQVDPYYPRQRPAAAYIHPRPPLMEESLRTDCVLLTHNHGDHTCLESIERIRGANPGLAIVGPSESAEALAAAGIPEASITAVAAGDSASAAGMTFHTVYAKPAAGDPANGIDPPDVQHLGYVVDTGAVRVYVSGDPINNFARHKELVAAVRDLRPDIGLLTNHPTEGEFPFFEGSAEMAAAIGIETAVPAHYGCFTTRDYDPHEWAAHLPDGVEALVIPYNQSAVYVPGRAG